jgi:hypothetical protein
MMTRRGFVGAMAVLRPAAALVQTDNPWAGPIVDCHHHFRSTPEANLKHLDGSGISNAMVLTRADAADAMMAMEDSYPNRFLGWFASVDVTRPDAGKVLTEMVKKGAIGFGELKNHVEAAGPELKRLYALAAELEVPILVHFQEVPHTPTEGVFATGFKDFESMLKKYPKTRFIGHADAFWANISADYANDVAYPTGKITPGGITNKLLADYPNLFRRHIGQLRKQRTLP